MGHEHKSCNIVRDMITVFHLRHTTSSKMHIFSKYIGDPDVNRNVCYHSYTFGWRYLRQIYSYSVLSSIAQIVLNNWLLGNRLNAYKCDEITPEDVPTAKSLEMFANFWTRTVFYAKILLFHAGIEPNSMSWCMLKSTEEQCIQPLTWMACSGSTSLCIPHLSPTKRICHAATFPKVGFRKCFFCRQLTNWIH